MSGKVAAIAAEEGHRRVAMPVHQPGQQHLAARVEHVVARARRHVGAELGDGAVDRPQRRHVPSGNTASGTVRARVTWRRPRTGTMLEHAFEHEL